MDFKIKNILYTVMLLIFFCIIFFSIIPKIFTVQNPSETTEPDNTTQVTLVETIQPTTLSIQEKYFQSYEYIPELLKDDICIKILEGENYINSLNQYKELIDVQEEIKRVYSIINLYNEDYNRILKEELYAHAIFKDIPEHYNHRDFKSYEDYTNITYKNSPHYKLQNQYAYTGNYGIRMVKERYCIALGSYFTTTIGQYIDIVLMNGIIIPCILGDQKSDAHTDALHIAHLTDGSILEFIVDKELLVKKAKNMGDISYCCEEWQSPVVQIIIYDKNIFTE